MATLFYDHLIDWPKLKAAVDALELDGEERLEIWEEIEHTIHTEVLIIFVNHLPAEKHGEFLERFHAAPYDESHFQFVILNQKKSSDSTGSNESLPVDIETAVRQRANELIDEILAELAEE